MTETSHQSALISCLTISNTRLPCLPSRGVSPGGCGIQGQNYIAMFQGSGNVSKISLQKYDVNVIMFRLLKEKMY